MNGYSTHHLNGRACKYQRRILSLVPNLLRPKATPALSTSQIKEYILPIEASGHLLIALKIVYLPTSPTPELQSFSSPILNLQDTYVRAPFFGANYWTGLCKPVADG